jgi:uncharacterized 2Fe-2S/4Fe-4S cluster protein (DUF4445 family)
MLGLTAADLVAIDMESQREFVMLVDVGTNTEVWWVTPVG